MLAALALSLQTPKIVVPAIETRAELRLTVDRPSVIEDEDPGYHATIRNTGRKPLRLIKPQDGSEIGMRNPEIGWRLPDLTTPHPIMRCGNTNAIAPSAFFTLAPGESREIDAGWMGFAELRPGSNRVSFTYDISARRKNGGVWMHSDLQSPTEVRETEARVAEMYGALTPIRLTSNVVRVTLRVAP